jgi:hypothetical protein
MKIINKASNIKYTATATKTEEESERERTRKKENDCPHQQKIWYLLYKHLLTLFFSLPRTFCSFSSPPQLQFEEKVIFLCIYTLSLIFLLIKPTFFLFLW